jgi:hypothetical protein
VEEIVVEARLSPLLHLRFPFFMLRPPFFVLLAGFGTTA